MYLGVVGRARRYGVAPPSSELAAALDKSRGGRARALEKNWGLRVTGGWQGGCACVHVLPLDPLEGLARLLLARFLAFDNARVAREEAGLQRPSKISLWNSVEF